MGGAFNPPHLGHLLLAQEARWQLGLERVLLMVTGRAPHKVIEPEPGAGVRLEMAELAASEGGALGQGVEASDLEVQREGPSYAYLTLEELRDREGDAELHFLMGADMAATLPEWERPERVVELARLAVVPRPEFALERARQALGGLGARSEVVEMPACGISSTMVRERAAEGRPLRHLVPAGVGELIEVRGLYR